MTARARDLELRAARDGRFAHRRLILAPGESRGTTPDDWAGAFVMVRRGRLEVACQAGGSRTFVAGDQLALGWLPLRTLRNAGDEDVELVAIRRRAPNEGPHRPDENRGE